MTTTTAWRRYKQGVLINHGSYYICPDCHLPFYTRHYCTAIARIRTIYMYKRITGNRLLLKRQLGEIYRANGTSYRKKKIGAEL